MGAGDQHLGAAGGAAHLYQIHLHHLTLGQRLALHLLVLGQHGLGALAAGADLQDHVAVAGVDPGDGAGEDLVLLGVELVIDHAVLRLAQALDDHLLAVAGGDTAEFHVLHRDVHHAAQLILGAALAGVLQRDLVGGIHDLLHDLLLDVHPQIVLVFVHVHDHILHALVIPLIGGGQSLNDLAHHEVLGDAPFLLQHGQRRENLITFHDLNSFYLKRNLLIKALPAGAPAPPRPFQTVPALRRPYPAAPRRPRSLPAFRQTPSGRPGSYRS